jgi:anaerobic selenocysteine-containing dehydrogenase
MASEGRANRPAPTAQRLGIADGDEVVVESPHGSVRAVAEVSRRIHREVVGAARVRSPRAWPDREGTGNRIR